MNRAALTKHAIDRAHNHFATVERWNDYRYARHLFLQPALIAGKFGQKVSLRRRASWWEKRWPIIGRVLTRARGLKYRNVEPTTKCEGMSGDTLRYPREYTFGPREAETVLSLISGLNCRCSRARGLPERAWWGTGLLRATQALRPIAAIQDRLPPGLMLNVPLDGFSDTALEVLFGMPA